MSSLFAGIEPGLINAPGSINGLNTGEILKRVDELARTAIGAISYGSLSVLPRAGNAHRYGGVDYYYDNDKRLTYNSIGLPGLGLEVGVEMINSEILPRTRAAGKPLLVSVSPTLPDRQGEIGNVFFQSQTLVGRLLKTRADAIVLNTCSPNLITEDGGRSPFIAYNLRAMEQLFSVMSRTIGRDTRVGIKLPPYQTPEQLALIPELGDMIRSGPFSFVETSNTIPDQIPRDKEGIPILSVPGGKGGMSGPATAAVGREQLRLWAEQLQGKKEIISVLGVNDGDEMNTRLNMGAALTGGVSFLWNSPSWPRAVNQMLSQYAKVAY